MTHKKVVLIVGCLILAVSVCALALMPVIASVVAPGGLDPLIVEQAADWLIGQQQPDGGFGWAGQTADAVLALVAAGRDPAMVITDTHSMLDYLALEADAYTGSGWDPASQAALLVQAVLAAGGNPYDLGGLNLVDRLNSHYEPISGTIGLGDWALASYIVTLDALRHEIPIAASDTLISHQLPSGAWEYLPSWGADLDTTARVLQALSAAGQPPTSAPVISATTYLSATQRAHGGWNTPWDAGDDPNANTTAQVIQGLLSAGKNPLTYTVSISGYTPIDAVMSLRNPATGAFQRLGADNILATAQAIPALQGHTFPYYGRGAAYRKAASYLAGVQQPDGGFAGWSDTSDASATLDVVLGAVAADLDPRDWAVDGITTPLDYLVGAAFGYVTPYTYTYENTVYTVTAAAQAGKLIAGVVAAGAYTTTVPTGTATFAGLELLPGLESNLAYWPPDNSVSDYAWAAIGYAALGQSVPTTVTPAPLQAQESNGGWSYYGDYAYGTAMAVQGLTAAGIPPTSTEMISATSLLHTLQDPATGGITSPWTGQADAVSTANVMQAIAALGLDPYDFSISPSSGTTLTVNTPDQWLLSTQSTDGDFGGTALATGQTLLGLSTRALPVHLRPIVVSTGLERRTGVAWDSAFRAVFNTELDPASVDLTTFVMEGPGGVVPAAVTHTERTATLTPTIMLQADATYRLTISGVRSARLGTLGLSYHWDITTVPHRTFLPVILKPQ
jgi:prenyltransferase beta subunit